MSIYIFYILTNIYCLYLMFHSQCGKGDARPQGLRRKRKEEEEEGEGVLGEEGGRKQC